MWGFLLQRGCAESARRDHPNAGLGEEGTPHRNLSIQVRIRRIPNRFQNASRSKDTPPSRASHRRFAATDRQPARRGHTSHKDKPNMSLDLSYVTNDMDPARNSDYIFVRRAPRLGQRHCARASGAPYKTWVQQCGRIARDTVTDRVPSRGAAHPLSPHDLAPRPRAASPHALAT